MPNFPAIGHETNEAFIAIVEPAAITHPLPFPGQNPWDETFYLWSDDVEATTADLDSRVTALELGGGPVVVPDASETEKGILELATPVEAEAGLDGTRAITAATLAGVLDAFLAQIFGPGVERLEPITRTAYTALTPKVATTLYIIDETL